MKYILKETLELIKWLCVGFVCAYAMASYHGLDTSFSNLIGA
jgi:hypothetical protein